MKKTATISALAIAIAAISATAGMAQSASDATAAKPVAQLASWFGGHGDGDKDGHGRGGKDGHGKHRDGKRGDERGEGRGKMMRQIQAFDLNKDGSVTQDEIDQARKAQIDKFDANKDGTLSLDEYQALWMDQMRERMVDAFQKHDNDGNGQVTPEEFNKRFSGMVERLDRNGDGKLNADDRGGRRPVAPAADKAPEAAPQQ